MDVQNKSCCSIYRAVSISTVFVATLGKNMAGENNRFVRVTNKQTCYLTREDSWLRFTMGNCNRRCYSLQGFEKSNAHQRRWPNPAFHLVVILVKIYMICSRPAKENAPFRCSPHQNFNCNLLHISWTTVLRVRVRLGAFAGLSPSDTTMWLSPHPWPNIQLLSFSHFSHPPVGEMQ